MAVPSAEHTCQLALTQSFLLEVVQRKNKITCAVCALLSPACDSHIMALTDLKQSGLLYSLSNTIHGLALTSSLHLTDGCMIVCEVCEQQICASVVPDFTSMTKWALGLVPPQLSGLTLLEWLLVTKHFYVKHMLNHAQSNDSNLPAYKVTIKPFADRTTCYQMNTLPISPGLISLVLNVTVWLNPHQNANQINCLLVHASHIHEALFWLKTDN